MAIPPRRAARSLTPRKSTSSRCSSGPNCATLSAAGPVLDISGVMFADRFAAILLCKLNDAGFMLEGCSGFIQELLRETRQRSARTDNEETRLIHGLRTGDVEAFELLARSYGGRVSAAAPRILPN